MANKRSGKPVKPSKPTPTFPLTPHASGKWCKRVGGKLYYFGSWDDPKGALKEYREIAKELQAGRDPRKPAPVAATAKDALILDELCNPPDRAGGTISAGVVEGMNNKVKLTTRKSYGFRTYEGIEITLYHNLGGLPEPEFSHRFC